MEKHEPANLAEFDLEAWVNGAVAAKDTVQVSSRAGLRDTLVDLMTRLDEVEKKDVRAAAKRAEIKSLEEQIAQTSAELEGSWVEVEFRTPTPSERREAFKGLADDDAEGRLAQLLAVTGRLRPVGSEEWTTLQATGWSRVFDAIGSGQFDDLSVKVGTLAFTKVVTPGFSQRASSFLETRRSARS